MAFSCQEQWILWAPEIWFQVDGRGIFFCLTPCVYTQNFVENSKMDEKHKKGF